MSRECLKPSFSLISTISPTCSRLDDLFRVSLHLGNNEKRKKMEEKPVFQIGTLSPNQRNFFFPLISHIVLLWEWFLKKLVLRRWGIH